MWHMDLNSIVSIMLSLKVPLTVLFFALGGAIDIFNETIFTPLKPKNGDQMCSIPLPPVEPELCCNFPNIFSNSIVHDCEIDFATVENSVSEIVTDSVREISNFTFIK